MKNLKYLNTFKLFESLNTILNIEQLLEKVNINPDKIPTIVNWWNENRSHIKIYYFPFTSTHPIAGVFLGTDIIVVNSKMTLPPHIRLFLALHESRHCDQHADGKFMEGYYNSVINGDKESFLQKYKELEKDANDFAINSMIEIGFEREMRNESHRLRSNEFAGEMVYRMMRGDIEQLNPDDFFDLLKKQIGY
jgi:hypothetical protein